MRLLQWASLGLIALTSANANLTHESRNILPSTFKPPQHFRNVNLVRNINLDKNYAKETVNVVIENIDKDPQSEYYLPFEAATIGRIGGVDVRDKKDPYGTPFAAEVVAIDPQRYEFETGKQYLSMLNLCLAQHNSTRSPFRLP